MQNLGRRILHFGEYGDKIEILSTDNTCLKFAAVCRTYCTLTVITHDVTGAVM